MEFIAIDVETANPDMASICQIGMASFRSGVVHEEWKTYVNPEDFFDPTLVAIHGIDEGKVSDAPNLPKIAQNLQETLRDKIVICHTHFDRSAVQRAFEKYSLLTPICTWLDTARVARRTWPEFSQRNYGLKNICAKIGYKYLAHDALEDAKAAGMVLLEASRISGFDLSGWLNRVREPIGFPRSDRQEAEPSPTNPEGPLQGETLVFTGALLLPRKEAAQLAAKIGCNVGDGVTKATTILVVGNQDIRRLNGEEKSSKHRKAEELISVGQSIRIIQESDFMKMVESVGAA